MADHSFLDEWFVRGEDGCLPTGTPAHSVIYHPILNVILLVAKDNSVLVVDVISGAILQQSNLCGKKILFFFYEINKTTLNLKLNLLTS